MTTPEEPQPGEPQPKEPVAEPAAAPATAPPTPPRPATAVLLAIITAATLVSVTAIISITVLILDIRRDRPAGAEASGSPSASDTPWWASPPSPTPSRFKGCRYRESPRKPARPVEQPVFDPAVDGKLMIAEIRTNRGTIVIELDGKAAPCTVASFRHLASAKFYDDTTCHRMTTSGLFVLQCGDPKGTGRGTPGYNFGDENLPRDEYGYSRGVVAMANSGPDTNGSQFFINYKDNRLDPNYSVFGRVTKGMEIIDRIAAGGVRDNNAPGDGPPKQEVVIDSIRVRPA